jgi:aspartate-semialdehyde dehydrogenase
MKNIAIVGATGVVGQTVLSILAERNFPIQNLYLVASSRSAGKIINFSGQDYTVHDIANFDFTQADIAFFAAGSDVAIEYAPKAVASGCKVIDKSSYYRYQDDVPLLVPEVNPQDIALSEKRGIIATPNCSTIQLVVALKPIYDAVGIERINICTYQSVSGAGQAGIADLLEQTHSFLANSVSENKVDCHASLAMTRTQFAFNVVPKIDSFLENDYTKEEMKLVWEVRKIFHDETIQINPTAVRVPVLYGHSEAVHIETKKKITKQEAIELLRHAPGIQVIEANQDFPTALSHAAGNDAVYVGRIREDISHERGLNLWIVADNLRKGAALNAVQIAELL